MPHSRRHSSKSTPRKPHRFLKHSRESWRRAAMLATVAATAALPHKRAHAAPATVAPINPSAKAPTKADITTHSAQIATAPFTEALKAETPKNEAAKTEAQRTDSTSVPGRNSSAVVPRLREPQSSSAIMLDVPSAIARASHASLASAFRPLKKTASGARATIPDAAVPVEAKPVFAASTPAVPTAIKPDEDHVLLAQLDEELQRTAAKLKATDEKLSEGQRQLLGLSGTLRNVMQQDGTDAIGLHPFVRVASRYAGTPYVWGGESRYGFDCSGFIIRVMRDLGYRALPHSAAEQFTYGEPVAQAFLRPGDLVFFANTYKPGISHVGIYIGKRHFIHAASTRQGTIISSLDSQPYSRKYAGARRLVSMRRA
jgi:cell wall-associated NlpC family hydrolase